MNIIYCRKGFLHMDWSSCKSFDHGARSNKANLDEQPHFQEANSQPTRPIPRLWNRRL